MPDEPVAEEPVAEERVAEELEVPAWEHLADESGAADEVSTEEPELGADIAVAASSTDGWRAPEPDGGAGAADRIRLAR